MDFQDVLDKYNLHSFSESDKGTKFEELIARYLTVDPLYSSKLEKVYLWKDFPSRQQFGGHDTGIDIVAKTKMGEYWAIQCKLYREGNRVSKKDIDTFFSTSGRKFKDESGKETSFAERFIFVTNDDWSSTADLSVQDQTIPVNMVSLSKLRDARVDWGAIEEGVHGESARLKRYNLKDHQKKALDNALEHYKANDRGSMIMACGTGKTFVSLRIAEAMTKGKKGLILFLTPSISLVGQTLREWTSQAEAELNTICVCSDPKVSRRYSKNDDMGERVEDLGAPATTDPERIVSLYRAGEGPTVVFSTYQSIDAVAEAQRKGLPDFDIAVCDEAHRTTGATIDGQDERSFIRVHKNENIRVNKRLYMTATPRLYGVKGKEDAKKAAVSLCSMDEESIYGKEFYKISFGQAVQEDLLSDYKVMVLTVGDADIPDMVKRHWTAGGKEIDADTNTKIWGCMSALAKNVAHDETLRNTDPGRMMSAVSFCRTIPRSRLIAKRFNEFATSPERPLDVAADHIDGSMNSMLRERRLNWLREDEGKCKILSNVRCLSEGVDVPALDAVMFIDSKGSLIDIVQSVGRVMRKAPGKKYGYIIVPIVVPEGEDPEEALDDNERYKVVWQVLRALRSHDERIDAEINTLIYNKKKEGEHFGVYRPKGSEADLDLGPLDGQYTLDDFGTALLARLVLKVGDREYIENWARDIAKIMPELMAKLKQVCEHTEHGYKQYKPAFNRYLKGLRACVNDNVTEEDAINMLAQQIVTKPIFNSLFGDDTFVKQNSVSQTIDAMLEEIHAKNGLSEVNLDDFYKKVENTLSKIEEEDGKQKVITSLYEKFFKNAFPKDQAINGVVYTPQEIVDFILRSAADVLKQEFGMDISSENVNVLDPFTGTGTFIARLMETGLISKGDLERKFKNELFANEITLLAYYIAAVNIENTYRRLSGTEEYAPFNHILLTDTFNLKEICRSQRQATLTEEEYFKKNLGNIREECKAPITVIVGNPPYGSAQKSANDNAKKRSYKNGIDSEIENTYLASDVISGVGRAGPVYDNYIRAVRWSTDRIGNEDGIIAFVTPNGWLSGGAFMGFRKCIENEFAKIYVFNLRGDQNSGNWREEGEKIFGVGSKVGISIVLLVRRKDFKGKATVLYTKAKDKMKRQDKLDWLIGSNSLCAMEQKNLLEKLSVKENGDWIIERDIRFQTFIPLAGDKFKKFENHREETIFVGYSLGYTTNRDPWAYNFSRDKVAEIKRAYVQAFNEQLSEGKIDYDDMRVKWTEHVEKSFIKKEKMDLNTDKIRRAVYRPFTTNWLDDDGKINSREREMPRIFPSPEKENLLICVAGIGVKKEFSCLITDKITDLEVVGKNQCFPLYWYDNVGEKRAKLKVSTLDGEETGAVRHDGISDYALKTANGMYSKDITKEDIFYYVYGYLHSPEYKSTFSEDLKLSLPRIDFVAKAEDFFAFSKAGRDLAELHLNYESVKPLESVKISGDMTRCNVTKMKVVPGERKVIYNQHITVENIPEESFEYIVNGKSAIGWVADQYQYSVDKESGIVNDPNEYAGGEYVLKLLLQVIAVSVKTMQIVKNLPKIDFDSGK